MLPPYGRGLCVDAKAPCRAIVEHGPLQGAAPGQANDAVGNGIVVGIGLKRQPRGGVGDAEIKLSGVFGTQVSVAHEGVIEVVQRRSAEHALVESPERPAPEGV